MTSTVDTKTGVALVKLTNASKHYGSIIAHVIHDTHEPMVEHIEGLKQDLFKRRHRIASKLLIVGSNGFHQAKTL